MAIQITVIPPNHLKPEQDEYPMVLFNLLDTRMDAKSTSDMETASSISVGFSLVLSSALKWVRKVTGYNSNRPVIFGVSHFSGMSSTDGVLLDN